MPGVLFDIVHPADVLFFMHPIRRLAAKGHQIHIASRHKDVTVTLLERNGLEHRVISTAGSGLAGLASELLVRDWRLWRLAREVRPEVMAGFGGVAISHVGLLTRTPSLSFYDTDYAPLQHRITLPFIREWHVTECYRGPVAAGRTFRFPGLKELSYFHPDNFRPDREIALRNGLAAEGDTFLVRVVAWRANHDVGRAGIPAEMLERIVSHLQPRGKVIISSEVDLPETLAKLAYRGAPEQIHHVMAHARLYIGESATMAAECVALGTPAVVIAPMDLGYIDMLNETPLLDWHGTVDLATALTAIDGQLSRSPESIRMAWKAFIDSQTNVADYVVSALERHLAS